MLREVGAPGFYCTDCDNKWDKKQATNRVYYQIRRINAFVCGYFLRRLQHKTELSFLNTSWLAMPGYGTGIQAVIIKGLLKAESW